MAKNKKKMKIMKRIQSKKHKLGTHETDKISLSCFDDKRYVPDDGIYTLAFFIKIVLQVLRRLKKIVIKNIVKKLHVSNKMIFF